MGLSEKVSLLSTYPDIPSVLTISAITTEHELELVSSEDYDRTMIDSIFPKVIKEDIEFYTLLEIDYQWLCRCIRMLSYGNEVTARSIICDDCEAVCQGEYKVDFRYVDCKPLPVGFNNQCKVQTWETFDESIFVRFHLLTIREYLDVLDTLYLYDNNAVLSRVCHMIDKVNDIQLDNPVKAKEYILNTMSAAEYQMICNQMLQRADYGLRSYGSIKCPKCKSNNARFLMLPNDIYFTRPWELNSDDDYLNVDGQMKTYQEVRQKLYEVIVDETLFIARASEGAVSAEWVMKQPVFIRKKYVEAFTKELKERESKLNSSNKPGAK